MTWQSEVLPLQSVILKRPADAFRNDSYVSQQWQRLNYLDKPDFNKAIEEHQRLVEYLEKHKIQVHYLPENDSTTIDAIYTRDASVATNEGMIICNMGKPDRNGEPGAQQQYFESLGIKIKGVIKAPGTLEGGDVAWIDEKTLSVARGYRTNDEGIRQLKQLVKDVCEDVIVFHAPHYKGPSDVFHLMSVYSPVDHKTAVVYSPLMAVDFREELVKRKINLIEVPEEEFESMGCNVLAVNPENCVMVKGNPITSLKLRNAGFDVFEYEGSEISLKGCGGPTCLTRPLERLDN